MLEWLLIVNMLENRHHSKHIIIKSSSWIESKNYIYQIQKAFLAVKVINDKKVILIRKMHEYLVILLALSFLFNSFGNYLKMHPTTKQLSFNIY